MRRIRRMLMVIGVLVLATALASIVGCGGTKTALSDKTPSANQIATPQSTPETKPAIYRKVSGVYVNPDNPNDMLGLYDDGMYERGRGVEYDRGTFTADPEAMTIKMYAWGTWKVAEDYGSLTDEEQKEWKKLLDQLHEAASQSGESDEALRQKWESLQKQMDEDARKAGLTDSSDVGTEPTGPEENKKSYTYAEVAGTYGRPDEIYQVTLKADGTYESGVGLAYDCGLYKIYENVIAFEADPTRSLSNGAPACGGPVLIGEGGQSLIDPDDRVWERTVRQEPNPYQPF
jgi:hypothetical protein